MSKLDAAIEWLREAQGCYGEDEPEDKQIDNAIRILEAAAKVNKREAIEWVTESQNHIWEPSETIEAVQHLLDSLPEEEK